MLVIVLSACLVAFIPAPDSVKSTFSLPGVAALFMLLVQGWRDQVAHERALEIQKRQNDFNIAIASHMANVVFDKQVDFCEKYANKLNSIVRLMFQEGPSDKTMLYENELRNIRIEYAPWISKELTQKINPFELALREIGALGMLEKNLPKSPDRSRYIERMFAIYAKFLGMSMEGIPREH